MPEKKVVEVLVSGGQATAGPPIGPALGPLGVNVVAIVNRINEETKEYAGMKVPVKIIVDVETKSFEISVGIPTTAALIVKEAGIQKGSGKPNTEKVGNLSFDQVVKIARIKRSTQLSRGLKASVKEIIGTCVSMGVTIDGKDPKNVLKEVDKGLYDHMLIDKVDK
ncbi:MAG: 50S ribosomal protein L11 [Nitrososphaerota archaeon]|nr:50S ribosomal protein L11 [Candidatus Bathyarchaeota archaeon]MDW8048769.1 50S ribosomal protein L11 [Nitrososphaerota archaeon]